MRGRDALTSSATDEWMTPPEVLARFEALAPIVFDPCASPSSGERMPNLRGSCVRANGQDGLRSRWGGWGHVFVNPPYSDMTAWADKVVSEAEQGTQVSLLVPARTDTRWFHHLLTRAEFLVLWRGRIRFLRPDGTRATGATFPSAVLTFNLPRDGVDRAFMDAGEILRV